MAEYRINLNIKRELEAESDAEVVALLKPLLEKVDAIDEPMVELEILKAQPEHGTGVYGFLHDDRDHYGNYTSMERLIRERGLK